jgi:hypothetical protein
MEGVLIPGVRLLLLWVPRTMEEKWSSKGEVSAETTSSDLESVTFHHHRQTSEARSVRGQ